MQSLPGIIKDVEKANNETQCSIEEIDQPGCSLSADVSDTSCDMKESLNLSIHYPRHSFFFPGNSKPRKVLISRLGNKISKSKCSSQSHIKQKLVEFANSHSVIKERQLDERLKAIIKVRAVGSEMLNNFRSKRDSLSSTNNLCTATITNNVERLKDLLSRGTSPNCKDSMGITTPLHIACRNGYQEIVPLLLQYGADAKCRDSSGDTPLHTAIKAYKASIVKLLLAAGTDPLLTNSEGQNSLQLVETKLRSCANYTDRWETRSKLYDILGILRESLETKRGFNQEVEALSNFCSRISLSSSTDQFVDELKNFLPYINMLNPNQEDAELNKEMLS